MAVFVWRGLRNYCLAPYCFSACCFGIRKHLRRGNFWGDESEDMDPRFCSEGDDGVGKHPSPSFSRRRKSRNTVSQEWTSVLKKCYEHYGLVYMRHAHFVLNEVLKV